MGLTRFAKRTDEDLMGKEMYHRLVSIFGKNKYGYHTRFMSDFDLFLDAILNEKFLEDSSAYYDDPFVGTEIDDQEAGLANDFSNADMKHLNHDKP